MGSSGLVGEVMLEMVDFLQILAQSPERHLVPNMDVGSLGLWYARLLTKECILRGSNVALLVPGSHSCFFFVW